MRRALELRVGLEQMPRLRLVYLHSLVKLQPIVAKVSEEVVTRYAVSKININ